MKFNGSISKEGILKINRRGDFDVYLKTLSDCNVTIEIGKKRKIRSLNQNAIYWLWLTVLSENTGYDKEEFHAMFKSMFLTDRAKKFPIVRSTTKLSTLQFMSYLNNIAKYCSQNEVLKDIPLPDPNGDEEI